MCIQKFTSSKSYVDNDFFFKKLIPRPTKTQKSIDESLKVPLKDNPALNKIGAACTP